MNSRRRRNVAKLIVHATVDSYLLDQGIDDAAMEQEIRLVQTGLLTSISDHAYDVAEADYRQWLTRPSL